MRTTYDDMLYGTSYENDMEANRVAHVMVADGQVWHPEELSYIRWLGALAIWR